MHETGIHIALVDDHNLFQQGLITMLQSEPLIESIQGYNSAKAFLNDSRSQQPEILLLDINMPEMSGLEAIKLILQQLPDIKIVMLSMRLSYSSIKDAIQLGAKGYLHKTAEKEEVLEAISKISRGKSYFADDVHEVMAGNYKSEQSILPVELTPREKEILSLICEELSTSQIADRLFISIHTVETHRRNLLSKTSSKNTAGLVKFAVNNKLD
ncbi:MAG: DNA-binding response regulator [Crocinitomicaceae bacterium]|nr:DNA-binding response regulator [Crocinitomicaceae bacterium]|tara:strand:- start:4568 stop:5206 length:639 start_codon:yes stop_codon:yes gene_type:complete